MLDRTSLYVDGSTVRMVATTPRWSRGTATSIQTAKERRMTRKEKMKKEKNWLSPTKMRK